jgi:hypothetical protein
MITIQVVVTNSISEIQAIINDYSSLEYVIRGDSSPGGFSMSVDRLKYERIFNPQNVDYRVQIFRKVNDEQFKLEGLTEFFVEVIDTTDTTIKVSGGDLQTLLMRRVNAYASGAPGSRYTDQCDDIIKQLVRNNFITALSGRDGSATNFGIGAYLTVSNDVGQGPTIDISCSRDRCLDAIISVCNASAYLGTWLAGRIISNTKNWTFNSYIGSFGIDRSTTVLSRESRNIENINIVYNRSEEYTSSIVGGSGIESNRYIGTADSANISLTPFYRKEYFYSNPQVNSSADAINYAYSLLRKYRPRMQFSADIINSNFFVRGIDFDIGDIVTVQFLATQYLCRINAIYVSISGSSINERSELNLV